MWGVVLLAFAKKGPGFASILVVKSGSWGQVKLVSSDEVPVESWSDLGLYYWDVLGSMGIISI